MNLAQKTANLNADRLHLQAAIEALRTSSPVPQGNSLSQVLKNQFENLASQADKDRSLDVLVRMLDQLLLDVRSHESALQASSSRVNHGLNRLKDLKFKFEGKMSESESLLSEIANLTESLEADRVQIGYDKRLSLIVGTFAVPTIEVG